MEIQASEMDVLLPGTDEYTTITGGQLFEVPANSSFKLQVKSVVDYCCTYS